MTLVAQDKSLENENLLGPSNITVQFQAEINGQALEFDKQYFVSSINDSLAINQLRFYISNFTFIDVNGNQSISDQHYFLIDFEDTLSLSRSINLNKQAELKQINFTIGVDSSKQSQGAHGGDLDPTKAMYWSWQSGYINFKLEGKSKKCPARNNTFQFHIGGFQAPYNTIQKVSFALGSKQKIVFKLDLNKILTKENIAKNFQVMSPNKKAMNFSNQLPQLFSIDQ